MGNKITYLSPSDKHCPVCGSQRIQSISRITGYLSLDERFGPGKVEERSSRLSHNNSKHAKSYVA
jgi:ribonucleoside-triphosphate reductase